MQIPHLSRRFWNSLESTCRRVQRRDDAWNEAELHGTTSAAVPCGRVATCRVPIVRCFALTDLGPPAYCPHVDAGPGECDGGYDHENETCSCYDTPLPFIAKDK